MIGNTVEAGRRVRQACDLIASAYRLSPSLTPADTLRAVKAAMIDGAEAAAADVREEVEKL